jgi:hypothetical protein
VLNNNEGFSKNLESLGPGKHLLAETTLTIRNDNNPKDVFIFAIIAVRWGSELARLEFRQGPAVVDGKLKSSDRGPFGTQDMGIDAHLYMVTPQQFQAYIQRRYEDVRAARRALGI